MADRVWRLLGVVVLLSGMLSGAAGAWAKIAHQRTVREHTYPERIGYLAVDGGSADVRIKAGAPDRVVVRTTVDWAVRMPVVDQTLADGALKVTVRCSALLGVNVLGCGVQLEIEVPADVSVGARVTSGSLQVRSLSGAVRVESTSGELKLDGVSGSVAATTASGPVVAVNLGSALVQTQAESGPVRISFIRPPQSVTVSTSSGPVDITVPTGSHYRVTGRSDTDTRTVAPGLPDNNSTNGIDVTTTSGPVRIGTPSGR
ncbi:DUF4097 family beta strand repeat-containing protein [Kitasatospora sp. NPDC050543]|uniref:DUF4097 family beta strand repeat-containing protein n=1 Tax=Kitasatospora sp. NPDC050543 TaxID=3364054 RepID=UPI0037B2BC94